MDTAILAAHGIDFKLGLSRCLNDEQFYERFLVMFLGDDTFPRAKEAFEQHDNTALFKCAHELKGVCGNAALTELYNAVSPLVELLRGGDAPAARVEEAFRPVEAAYLRAREGIELATGRE